MGDRLSEVPQFSINGATFVCWAVDDGRYVWRSKCGRYAAGRRGALHWARRDGGVVGSEFPTLRAAMEAVVIFEEQTPTAREMVAPRRAVEGTGKMQQLVYAGVPIGARDEMLSLTDMWQAAGADQSKRPPEWARSVEAQNFIGFLTDSLNVGISHVWNSEPGRYGGTYAHWQIGLAYAKYLSPEFHAWCNEVVRAYMEGGGIAVTDRAPGNDLVAVVQGLAEIQREQSATHLLAVEKIAQGIAVRFNAQDDKLDAMDEKIDGIAGNVSAALQIAQEIHANSKRRKRPAAATVAQLLRTCHHAYGGRCPRCQTTVIMVSGEKLPNLQIDHFLANSLAVADAVWPICDGCHKEMTRQPALRTEERTAFDNFQRMRKRLCEQQGSLELRLPPPRPLEAPF